jgi:hypothetical protein
LNIPETKGIKTLTIEVPPGVINPSGSPIYLAPRTEHVDIPIYVTDQAPDEFKLEFHLVIKEKRNMLSSEISKEHSIKIRK